MRNPKSTYTIRLIVAAYLVYLAVKLIRDATGGADDMEHPALFILFGVLFIAVAGVLCYQSFRGLAQAQKEMEEEEAEDEEELKEIEENISPEERAALEAKAQEQAEEAASDGPMSIADRMRVLSGREFDEEDVADAADEEAGDSEE